MNSIGINHSYGFLAPFEKEPLSEFKERIENIKRYENLLNSKDLPQIARASLMGLSIKYSNNENAIKDLSYWKKFQIYQRYHLKQVHKSIESLVKYHERVLQAITETPLQENQPKIDLEYRKKRLALLNRERTLYTSYVESIEKARIELEGEFSNLERCIFKICAFFLGRFTCECSLYELKMKPPKANTPPVQQSSSIENLILDVLFEIFKYLPPEDLSRVSRTSLKMRMAIRDFDSSCGFAQFIHEKYGLNLTGLPVKEIRQIGLKIFSTLAIGKKLHECSGFDNFLSFDKNDQPELKSVEQYTKDFDLSEKAKFYYGEHIQKLSDKVTKIVITKIEEIRLLVNANSDLANDFSLNEIRDQIVQVNILKREILALLRGLRDSKKSLKKFKGILILDEKSVIHLSFATPQFKLSTDPKQITFTLNSLHINRRSVVIESQLPFKQTSIPVLIKFELETFCDDTQCYDLTPSNYVLNPLFLYLPSTEMKISIMQNPPSFGIQSASKLHHFESLGYWRKK